jgi:hypothetical protein
MLVDKKFYYISLPRCASTSFHYTCLRHRIPIQTLSEDMDLQYQNINVGDFTNEELKTKYVHMHEQLTTLQKKFGENYPVIAVKRDRHETFISLWKYIIDHVRLEYKQDLYEKFSKLTIDDILFFKPSTLPVDYSKIEKLAIIFFKKNNIEWKPYLLNLMITLYIPKSAWHGDNKNIIWFDFNKLNEMEEWVSSILEKPFKLENFNTSQHIKSSIKLDNHFKSKYNSVYDIHDIRKSYKTLV